MFRHPKINSTQGEFKDINLDSEFHESINQSIRHFIVPATKEKSDVLNALLNNISGLHVVNPVKRNTRKLYLSIGSAAAAACIILFAIFFTFSTQTQTISQNETNKTFFLPDNSKVTLASDSKIRYSRMFFTREVELDGEAYFEVEKGSSFEVKTANGEVRVLGTKFSVVNRDESFIVQCFEGKVEVNYKDEEKVLIAGDKFVGGYVEPEITIAETIEEPAEQKDLLFEKTFSNKSLSEIWPVIEKHFGVTIYSNIPVDKKFTGSIRSENVNEVIETICTSLDISYMTVSQNEYLIQNGI